MFLARVLGYERVFSPGLLPRTVESSGQDCVTSGQVGQMCVHRYAYVCIYAVVCSCAPWPAALLWPRDWLFRDSSVGTWQPGAGQVIGSGLQQTDFMSMFLQHLSIKGNII